MISHCLANYLITLYYIVLFYHDITLSKYIITLLLVESCGTHQIEPVGDRLCMHCVVLGVLRGLTHDHDGLGACLTLGVPAQHPHLVQVLDVVHLYRHLVSRDDLSRAGSDRSENMASSVL